MQRFHYPVCARFRIARTAPHSPRPHRCTCFAPHRRIVQDPSEFLTIASSGLLGLTRALFEGPDQGTSFDVGPHVGSLAARLAYFWRDLVTLAIAAHRVA